MVLSRVQVKSLDFFLKILYVTHKEGVGSGESSI